MEKDVEIKDIINPIKSTMKYTNEELKQKRLETNAMNLELSKEVLFENEANK